MSAVGAVWPSEGRDRPTPPAIAAEAPIAAFFMMLRRSNRRCFRRSSSWVRSVMGVWTPGSMSWGRVMVESTSRQVDVIEPATPFGKKPPLVMPVPALP